jgi:predicted DNA-binding protein
MTVTLVIPDATDLRLAAQASRTGKPLDDVILALIERGLTETEFEDAVHDIRQEVWREQQADKVSSPAPDPDP